MSQMVAIPQAELAAFCQRHAIRKLALFGSVLRDDFRTDSDLDVLVEFEPEAHIGWEFIDIQDELSELFGRKVDLHTPNSLSQSFRDKVVATAYVIYERTGQDSPARYAGRSTTSAQISPRSDASRFAR